MEYERLDRDAALADMGSRLAGPALRARRRHYDIFVTPDAPDAVWDGPAVEAERSRFAPSADAQSRPALAAMLLSSVSGFARQVPWQEFRGSARRMTALCVMGAAGFGLVMTDAKPGAPERVHSHRESTPIIADISPEAAAAQVAAATPVEQPAAPVQTQSAVPALADEPAPLPVQEARVVPASAQHIIDAPAQAAAPPEAPARAANPPRVPAAVQRVASLPGWSSRPAPRPAVIMQALPARPVRAPARMARAAQAAARPALPAIRQAMVAPPRPAPVLLVRAMARRPVNYRRMATPDIALPHWLTDSEAAMPHVRIMSPQPHMLEGSAPVQEAAVPSPAPHPVYRPQYQPPVYANYAPRPAPPQYYGYQPYYPPAYYPGYYPGYYAN